MTEDGVFVFFVLLLFFFLALAVGCGKWAESIAGRKGRHRSTWAILGFLLGLIAVALVALLPYGGPPCSACRKPMHPEATVCPHCGTAAGPMKSRRPPSDIDTGHWGA